MQPLGRKTEGWDIIGDRKGKGDGTRMGLVGKWNIEGVLEVEGKDNGLVVRNQRKGKKHEG